MFVSQINENVHQSRTMWGEMVTIRNRSFFNAAVLFVNELQEEEELLRSRCIARLTEVCKEMETRYLQLSRMMNFKNVDENVFDEFVYIAAEKCNLRYIEIISAAIEERDETFEFIDVDNDFEYWNYWNLRFQ